MRVTIYLLIVVIVASIGVLPACETIIPEFKKAEVLVVGDTIFIVDNRGKRWDVTHAVNVYRMFPSQFEHGLGQDAIRPLHEPKMFSDGQLGYPAPDKAFQVIGVKLNGFIRSYKVEDLNSHEIVNEKFGDEHVAVGW